MDIKDKAPPPSFLSISCFKRRTQLAASDDKRPIARPGAHVRLSKPRIRKFVQRAQYAA